MRSTRDLLLKIKSNSKNIDQFEKKYLICLEKHEFTNIYQLINVLATALC